jgi:hypothetical protein
MMYNQSGWDRLSLARWIHQLESHTECTLGNKTDHHNCIRSQIELAGSQQVTAIRPVK